MATKQTPPPAPAPYVDATGKPIPPENFDNDFPPPEPRKKDHVPDDLDRQIEDAKPKR